MNPIVQQVLHETQQRIAVLEEKNKELKKRLDEVTVVVDLMARIEHAKRDKIKENQYLYVYNKGSLDIPDFYCSLHELTGMDAKTHHFIGKLKLGVHYETT